MLRRPVRSFFVLSISQTAVIFSGQDDIVYIENAHASMIRNPEGLPPEVTEAAEKMKETIPVEEIKIYEPLDWRRGKKDTASKRELVSGIMEKSVIVGESGLPLELEKSFGKQGKEYFLKNPEDARNFLEEHLIQLDEEDELHAGLERQSLETELRNSGIDIGSDPNLVTRQYGEKSWRTRWRWLGKAVGGITEIFRF